MFKRSKQSCHSIYRRSDGIGPDIWEASVNVFDNAVRHAYGKNKKIEWLEVLAGEKS